MRKKFNEHKKTIILTSLVIFGMIFVQIGSAALSSTLSISGDATVLPPRGKILYAPMDDIGTATPDTMLLYAPMDGVGTTNSLMPPNLTDSVTDTTFAIKGGSVTDSSDSKVGTNSAYFSGAVGQRINASIPSLNFGTNDFTISFWINPETTQPYPWSLLISNDTDAIFELGINWNNSPIIGLRGHTNASLPNYINTNKTFTPNVWTHYALVRKDGIFTIYENGINIGSTVSYKTATVDLSNLSIGGNNYTKNTYKGYIDDFAIYDYAKYDSGFTPPTTGQTDANLLYLDFESDVTYNHEPIKEEISDTYFTNVANSDIEGKDDEYKFGGSSLYFPGTASQRINIQNPNLNFGTNDFTISFWINPETTQPYPWSLLVSNDNDGTFDFGINWNNNSAIGLRVSSNSSLPNYINTNKTFSPNVWTHYALVRKNGVFNIYENGINIGSTSVFATTNIDLSNLSIGGNNYGKNVYKGYIDDFTIYSYAKYDSNFTPPTTDAMNDPANIHTDKLEIRDEVSSNDFTVLGNANVTGTDTEKKFGDASLYFPGTTGQRINASIPNLDFGTKDFTISFWINPETTQPYPWSLLVSNDNDGTFDFGINWNNSPIVGLRGHSNASLPNYINTNKTFSPNVWTHYALVRKNGVFNIYENGINIGSTSAFATTNIDLSNLSIGGNNYGKNAYKGYIDDFIIYNYAVWDSDFLIPTTAGTP